MCTIRQSIAVYYRKSAMKNIDVHWPLHKNWICKSDNLKRQLSSKLEIILNLRNKDKINMSIKNIGIYIIKGW